MQYYDANCEPAISFVGRKIRQWRPETGGTASAEPIQQTEALREATRFFRAVRMRGICSMEFKWSSADRKLYMIEPTACRADYQEGVAIANGYNIPLAAYADAVGRRYACLKPRKKPVKWLHMGDDYLSAAHYVRHGGLTWREYARSLSGPRCYAIYASEDRDPFFELMRRKVAGKFKRLCSWNSTPRQSNSA
jgi:predicted ATP-grasp superfamily ATP-dependent carboligase